MRKYLLLLLLLIAIPINAHATRCWVTLVKIGNGDVEHGNAKRPALGEMKKKFKALAVGQEGTNEELVLVIINSADLPTLKKVASRYHGKEKLDASGNRVFSKTLRAKLVKEAVRLGAAADWDPEKRNVAGE